MEVHRILDPGLLVIIYKDALEIEFKKNKIPYMREKEFEINYKGSKLPHKFYADFVIYDDIILEENQLKKLTTNI